MLIALAHTVLIVHANNMVDTATLLKLCNDEHGAVKSQPEARAAIINHLILEEMIDIDEAENLADKTMQKSGLWPTPQADGFPPAPE